MKMSDVTRGPWGDSNATGRGTPWKWKPNGPITRIEMSGNIYHVTSITFKSHNDSANFGSNDSYRFPLDLKPSEYLTGISGAYGEWGPPRNVKYITSLSFETNLGNVTKPWPRHPNSHISGVTMHQFSYKTEDGGAITGFHGVYGCSPVGIFVPGPDHCVNSIGIYEKSLLPPPYPLSDVTRGPWGDSNATGRGTPWKWKPNGPITRIEMSGNIYHVTSITFRSHNDSANFGSNNSHRFPLDLKPSEYLTGISGAYGEWGPPRNVKYITSLSFETNLGNVTKPWPRHPNSHISGVTMHQFSYKTEDGGAITGFHGVYGCSPVGIFVPGPDHCVNSIGIYEKSLLPPPYPLICINSPSEYLTSVRGTYKFFDDTSKMILESLTFSTSEEKVYGPYGGANSGYPFQHEINKGVGIVGFLGLIDNYLNALGVFVKPLPPSPLNYVLFVEECGGSDGKAWKFQPNDIVTQIIIFHSKVIHSLMFKTDVGNESEKLGGNGGTKSIVDINAGVSLKGIKGTFGKTGFYIVLTSLSFDTSDGKVHGPFGEHFGTEFSLSVEGSVVGFHGHAGAMLNAIGVYVKP